MSRSLFFIGFALLSAIVISTNVRANELHEAILDGDSVRVPEMLESGEWIDALGTRDRITPLILACERGNLSMVNTLLAHGPNLYKMADGRNAMDAAFKSGNEAIIKRLKAAGLTAPTHGKAAHRITRYLCESGNLDLLKKMLEEETVQVDVYFEDGARPFLIACKSGNKAMVDHFLNDLKEDILYSDYNNKNALMYACESGNLELVKFLIGQGFRIDERTEKRETALYFACYYGHMEIAKYLLSLAESNMGEGLIQAAERSGNSLLVDYLLTQKQNSKYPGIYGCLDYESAVYGESLPIFKKVMECNTPLNDPSRIFILAAKIGNAAILQELLKTNLLADHGFSPIEVFTLAYAEAVDNGNTACAKLLIEAMPATDLEKNKNKLYFMACRGGSLPLVKYFEKFNGMMTAVSVDNYSPNTFARAGGTPAIIDYMEKERVRATFTPLASRAMLAAAAQSGDTLRTQDLLNHQIRLDLVFEKQGGSALNIAIQNGNTPYAQFLLNNDAPVNLKGKSFDLPILEAAKRGHFEIVKLIMARQANVEARDHSENTPLLLAAADGNPECVQYLLEADANPNAQNKDGVTPLMYACQAQSYGAVQKLLNAKANPKLQDKNGNTALHYAARIGEYRLVNLLLEKNAPPNEKNRAGETPLMFAAESGDADIVKRLIEARANVNISNKNGQSALHYAARQNGSAVVHMLLAHKAQPKAKDKTNTTPLIYACQTRAYPMVKILAEKKAGLNEKNNDDLSPFFAACSSRVKFDPRKETPKAYNRVCGDSTDSILVCLLESKVSTLVKRKDGLTPFLAACQNVRPEMLKYLIQHKVSPNDKTRNGTNSLMMACKGRYPENLKILLDAKISAHSNTKEGMNVSMFAAQFSNDEMLKILDAHKVDLRKSDRQGKNALFYALDAKNYDGIEFLLNKKVSPTERAKNKKSFIDLVEERDDADLIFERFNDPSRFSGNSSAKMGKRTQKRIKEIHDRYTQILHNSEILTLE